MSEEKKTKYPIGTFVTIPNVNILRGQKPNVLATYFWIVQHSDTVGLCHPSRRLIKEEAGISEQTVDRAIRKLLELGVLTKRNRFIKRKKDNKNEQTSNEYRVISIDRGSPLRDPGSPLRDPGVGPIGNPGGSQITYELYPLDQIHMDYSQERPSLHPARVMRFNIRV